MLMLAAAAGLCAQPPRKTAVESLVLIPAEAELVCQSARDGEPSPFQQLATEIYVAGREGGHFTRITHQRKLYNHMAVSPDRRRIAAGRFDRGDTNGDGYINAKDKKTLVVLDLEHRQEWTLADDAEDTCLGGVDWTPDGQYIIASMRVAGEVDIYRIRPDTGEREALTRNLGTLLGGIPKPVFVSDVSVSFDGNWIVFVCVARGTAVCRLARMRIDGSEAHFITDGGGAAAKNARSTWGSGDFDPEFSPDGQYVSFQRSTPAGVGPMGFPTYDVMRVKIDGTDLLRLSPPGNQAVHGISDWSADNQIVFSEWNTAQGWSGPVLVKPDGSGYHRVEKLKGCTWVRWIPAPQ
jgi:Tol biopolymer transport system component